MYYFIGIKGTGMAALASILSDLGYEVIGSDLDKHFFTEDDLLKRGIKILPFNPNNIKDNYTVIIGNAFLDDFEEVKVALSNPTCKCYRYHEFLGEFIKNYISIGVTGSHGKTTTTTMLKNVLNSFDNTGYLIGDGEGHVDKNAKYICIEADEFRRHFLSYNLDYAIINNIEIDHIDYFKDEIDYFNAYQEFVKNVKNLVIYNGEDKWCNKLDFNGLDHFSYGLNKGFDFYATNIIEKVDGVSFDFYYLDKFINHFDLKLVGRHLLLDSLGVISLAYKLNYDLKVVEVALNNSKGPKRRYVIEEYNGSVFIDDYAHHPTEVKVTLECTKLRYPNDNIVAVFKPHRASRVKYFLDEFAESLKLADKVYLLDFTSIDDKQDGSDIDINALKDKISGAEVLEENENGAKLLAKHAGSVFVFMSSKDIYNLANLTKNYIK